MYRPSTLQISFPVPPEKDQPPPDPQAVPTEPADPPERARKAEAELERHRLHLAALVDERKGN